MKVRTEKVKDSPELCALGNAVSHLIYRAVENGMGADVAISVAVQVAVDYARECYGPEYVKGLGEHVTGLAGKEPWGTMDGPGGVQ